MRIRFSYACAQLISLPFAEVRFAMPTNNLSAFICRFLSELRTLHRVKFPSGEIKLSAVIETLKNAGDVGTEQKVLADCKPINTP